MTAKEPMLLTVLIETADLRWYVAAIGLAGEPLPLLMSEIGNLIPYVGVAFDEQVSFLRHRLAGALQRGCDRLWGRQKKPCHIVFVADGPFAQAPPELTPRVAEHFVEWMTSPPVVFFTRDWRSGGRGQLMLRRVAGELADPYAAPLHAGLAAILGTLGQPDIWELAAPKRQPDG
jgi:hypothetical protein